MINFTDRTMNCRRTFWIANMSTVTRTKAYNTVGNRFQSELTAKGHEAIALKSEIRDLLQKLELKERRVHELEGKCPERCGDDGDGGNRRDNRPSDTLYSLVGRLNEQVSYVRYRKHSLRNRFPCNTIVRPTRIRFSNNCTNELSSCGLRRENNARFVIPYFPPNLRRGNSSDSTRSSKNTQTPWETMTNKTLAPSPPQIVNRPTCL